jgi:serine/threonine-protein kinase
MNSSTRLVSFRAVAGVILVTALAVGALVLVRGNGNDTPRPAPAPTAAPTTRAVASSTTTPRPTPVHEVSVPNVIGLTRPGALVALADAGFGAHVTSMAMSSVPDGFVVSQSPLPATQLQKGSTVALVVSAAR